MLAFSLSSSVALNLFGGKKPGRGTLYSDITQTIGNSESRPAPPAPSPPPSRRLNHRILAAAAVAAAAAAIAASPPPSPASPATVRPRRLPSPSCGPPPRSAPVVKISDKLNPYPVDVYAKCEFFNPLASVKDRLALAIIQDAEERGALKPGDTVVEASRSGKAFQPAHRRRTPPPLYRQATSGNTGIAVAMVCAQRGYDCVICMAEPFSVERRRLMRMLGAKVRPAR